MDIKYNKDKSVTINATSTEYSAICMAVTNAYNQADVKSVISLYKPIMDAINKTYNERVFAEGE